MGLLIRKFNEKWVLSITELWEIPTLEDMNELANFLFSNQIEFNFFYEGTFKIEFKDSKRFVKTKEKLLKLVKKLVDFKSKYGDIY